MKADPATPPDAAAAAPPTRPAAEAVLTFLQSVGRPSEAELYLKLFRQLPKESFAIIGMGSPVIQRSLGSLLEQLKFLAELGLVAPLLVGLFDPDRTQSSVERLMRRMPSVGLDPVSIDLDGADVATLVRAELRRDRTPILFFRPRTGEASSERLRRLSALAERLDTRKVVLLRRRGALRGQREQPIELAPGHVLGARGGGISIINLQSDRAGLLSKKLLPRQDAELFEHVCTFFDSANLPSLLVSITSPLDLLRELFTVKGAGTLVKRGTWIERKQSYADIDVARLRRLLEASFGRPLRDAFFERPPLAIYVEPEYRGAAVLEHSPIAAYLSKFAVEPLAQGEGMGLDLLQAILRDHPALFWRTRADNSISSWYATLADGVIRMPRWHVFWRGLPPADAPRIVAEALNRPEDF